MKANYCEQFSSGEHVGKIEERRNSYRTLAGKRIGTRPLETPEGDGNLMRRYVMDTGSKVWRRMYLAASGLCPMVGEALLHLLPASYTVSSERLVERQTTNDR